MKYIACLICFLSGIIALAGCTGSTPVYTDASKVIDVTVGDQFNIVLDSNATTGYTWQAAFDQGFLKLIKEDYQQNKVDSNMVGVPGKQYFTFKAQQSGKTEIVLSYKRPWEQNSIETKAFSVNIK